MIRNDILPESAKPFESDDENEKLSLLPQDQESKPRKERKKRKAKEILDVFWNAIQELKKQNQELENQTEIFKKQQRKQNKKVEQNLSENDDMLSFLLDQNLQFDAATVTNEQKEPEENETPTTQLKSKMEKQERKIEEQQQTIKEQQKRIEEQQQNIEDMKENMAHKSDIEGQVLEIVRANRNTFEDEIENAGSRFSKLPEDTFSFMTCSKVCSIPFWLGVVTLGLQVAMFALLADDLLYVGDNPLDIPANVETQVRVTQVIAILVSVFIQDDFRDSFDQLSESRAIDGVIEVFEDSTSMKWWISCLCRLLDGMLGLVLTFFLIVKEETVVDILINFTAMGFVASLDNMAFSLSLKGIFGVACLVKAEEIQDRTYRCGMKRPLVPQLLVFIAMVSMLAGWGILARDQIQSKYPCKTIHVDFADNVNITLGGFSGFYDPHNYHYPCHSDNRLRYFLQTNRRIMIAYCRYENAWTISRSEYPCEWIAKSSETDTFDILETVSSPWVTKVTNSDVEADLDYVKITCFDEFNCDKSARDICTCPDGYYGATCNWDNPCQELELELSSPGFPGNRNWSREYELLSNTQEHHQSIQAYNHPVYIGKNSFDDSTTDIIIFTGRRWILTHTGLLDFEGFTDDDILNGQRKEVLPYVLAEYFLEFDILDIPPASIAYISESTLSSETPIGLRWFYGDYSKDPNSILPLPDANHLADVVLSCACSNGERGDKCQIKPLADGICNPYYNDDDHNYDAGDCCAATCTRLTCGKILSSTFAVETSFNNIFSNNGNGDVFSDSTKDLSGYPNCNDPLLSNITIALKNTSPGDEQLVIHIKLKCGGVMILNTTETVSASITINGVYVKESTECQLITSTVGNQSYSYDIYGTSSALLASGHGNRENESAIRVYLSKRCLWRDWTDTATAITYNTSDPFGQVIRWIDQIGECSRDNNLAGRTEMIVIDDRVTEIRISHGRRSSSIPTEIGLFSDLDHLSLRSSQLTGKLPSEIGLLTKLQYLDLDNNTMTGTIFTEITNLTQLVALSLIENELTGTIPTEIEKLTQLDSLYLYENKLTGTIPTEMARLTKLKYLHLSRNKLTGTIPSEISNLTQLIYFHMRYNELTGTIPTEISQLTQLLRSHLNGNELTGTIPTEMARLTQLKQVWLSDNKLTGTIPAGLCDVIAEEIVIDCDKVTCPSSCDCRCGL